MYVNVVFSKKIQNFHIIYYKIFFLNYEGLKLFYLFYLLKLLHFNQIFQYNIFKKYNKKLIKKLISLFKWTELKFNSPQRFYLKISKLIMMTNKIFIFKSYQNLIIGNIFHKESKRIISII